MALGEAAETSRAYHAPALSASQYAEVIHVDGSLKPKPAPFLHEAPKKCGTPASVNRAEGESCAVRKDPPTPDGGSFLRITKAANFPGSALAGVNMYSPRNHRYLCLPLGYTRPKR